MFAPNTRLGRIAGNIGSAQMNFRQGNTLGGVVDVGNVARDMVRPLLIVKASILAIASLPLAIKAFGSALIEAKRELGQINPTYGVALARLDIDRFRRNVRFAQGTGRNFAALTRTTSRLEDKLLPYAMVGANALMKIVSLAQSMATTAIGAMEKAGELTKINATLNTLARWFGVDAAGAVQGQPLADLSRAIGNGNFVMRQRPPGQAGLGGAAQGNGGVQIIELQNQPLRPRN